jgi:hypothetical protein
MRLARLLVHAHPRRPALQFGVTSAHGPFISSGFISTDAARPSATAAGAPASSSALAVRMLRNPQDGSADLQLHVAMAPSYVTYSPAAVQDVVDFFRSEQTLELSRLQAQAAARTDKLRRMAQLQIAAMSQQQQSQGQKQRMQLVMTLHAPKVAIPGGLRWSGPSAGVGLQPCQLVSFCLDTPRHTQHPSQPTTCDYPLQTPLAA